MGKRKKKQTCSKPGTSAGNSRSDDEKEELRPLGNAGTEYERERLSRIQENRARMQALGLPKMAASLARNTTEERGNRGKGKQRGSDEEDDEYEPNLDGGDGDEDELDSLSEGFEDEDDDEDYVNGRSSNSRRSAKANNKKSRAKKKVSVQKLMDNLEFMDEDEALKKAIAFSLEDSREASSQRSYSEAANGIQGKGHSPQQTGKKGRKSITNRVQMNEDDVVIHFCQFDEIGKGSITIRDLQRMGLAHDFTWTDKELMDMIRCFDGDGDGKLTIEDFRNIVVQCNMLQASEK